MTKCETYFAKTLVKGIKLKLDVLFQQRIICFIMQIWRIDEINNTFNVCFVTYKRRNKILTIYRQYTH